MSNTEELEKRLKNYEGIIFFLYNKLKIVIEVADRANEDLENEMKWNKELLEFITKTVKTPSKINIKKNKKFYDFLFCNF
jgi:hypothetical protein